ncbi:MAG: type IV pilus secretin PilQ [Candidatus Latescibacterota bacterium]
MKKLSMVRRSVILFLLSGIVAIASSATGEIPGVVSMNSENSENGVKWVIERNGDIELQDFQLQNPPRLVLDFLGARHQLDKKLYLGDGKLVERVRTSQYTNAPQEVTRVVFDLQIGTSYRLAANGNKIVVAFFEKSKDSDTAKQPLIMKSTTAPSTALEQVEQVNQEEQAAGPSSLVIKPEELKSNTKITQPQVPATAPTPNAWRARVPAPAASTEPAAQTAQPTMANAWQNDAKGEVAGLAYTYEAGASASMGGGNRVMSIDVQNADIKSVLRSISEFSNTNIISGPEVEGMVTAHLKDIPWRQAMDISLKSHGFDFREEYGIIRVSTIENLTKEELELQTAARKKDDLLPLTTEIINLSFANADEMKDALQRIVSKRGNIEVEKGSNALVVTDIEQNIEKVRSMCSELDLKLKQVEIVAKMVDVDFEATREFGIRWDAMNLSPANVSVVGDGIVDALTSNPIGQFRVGTVRSWGEVQAIIDMLERENRANIISNPRIITADNRAASILVGKQIPLIVADEAGNPITELTKVGIGLRVTPHVNSDGTVTMDLHPEVSELSAQATVQGGVIISISEADTRVVVADGETAVIGGLINEVETKIESGLPLLKDIPMLGNLFKFQNDTKKKRELIIFVTPKIIDAAFATAK